MTSKQERHSSRDRARAQAKTQIGIKARLQRETLQQFDESDCQWLHSVLQCQIREHVKLSPRSVFPGPGAYSPQKPFAKLSPRFIPALKTYTEDMKCATCPGPGEYPVPEFHSPPAPTLRGRTKQKTVLFDTPGPGAYNGGPIPDQAPLPCSLKSTPDYLQQYKARESGSKPGPGSYIGNSFMGKDFRPDPRLQPLKMTKVSISLPGPGSHDVERWPKL